MNKTFIIMTATLGILQASTDDNPSYESRRENYKTFDKELDEAVFNERLKTGFERRKSVSNFRSLETEDKKLPVQPKYPKDATKLLVEMYNEAYDDVSNMFGRRDPSLKNRASIDKKILIAIAEKYTFPLHNGEWPLNDKETNLDSSTLVEKIKSLKAFKDDLILAHADEGMDIRWLSKEWSGLCNPYWF